MTDQEPPQPVKIPSEHGEMLVDTREQLGADVVYEPAASATHPQPVAQDLSSIPEPEIRSSFDQEMDGPTEKWLVLGGMKYRCVDKLPARTFSRLVSTVNGLALLKNLSKNDPASVAQVAISFERMIDVVEYLVIDEHWEVLDSRLDSKTDPIEFPELLQSVMKVFPQYTGTSNPKA